MQVAIVPLGGTPCRVHAHDGQFFAETPGAGEYLIRLHNDSPNRREAVLSVDGIDAVGGKDASFANRGWIIGPWATADIKGWFRSNAEVAAFVFAAAGSGASYAEKTGRGVTNVGVVSVAVFDESDWRNMLQMNMSRDVFPTRRDIVYGSSTEVKTSGGLRSHNCSATVNHLNAPSDVSTAYGRRVEMQSGTTSFIRSATTPSRVITLRYATRETLRSWGVPVDAPAPVLGPDAWPANAGVPAPSGWTG